MLLRAQGGGGHGVPQRTLNMTVWLRLMQQLQPERTPEQAGQLFHFLDPDANNSIDVKEWTLGLRDAQAGRRAA